MTSVKGPSNTSWTAEGLKSVPVENRAALCPEFLRVAIEKARKDLNVSKVWVLGSRARGDASALSDYDLVFEVPEPSLSAWPGFVGGQRETAKTLLPVDWILQSQMSAEMKASLLREGVLLYEKK